MLLLICNKLMATSTVLKPDLLLVQWDK